MSTATTLKTERTRLTLLTAADLPAMMDMAREPDTFKYIKKLRIMNEQEYAQFLQVKLEQIRNKTGFHWAVWLKDVPSAPPPRTFIGAVNLNPVAGTSMMQIGCQLKRDYWGRGFASELTKCILDFGINDLGFETIYGLFEKKNDASRRLMQKLGFVWQETKDDQGVELEIHKYPAS